MGKWVTIKGAHVYIEDDGSVSKGPKSFIKRTKTVNERLDEEFHKGNITRQQYEKAKTDGWTHADLDKAIAKKQFVRKTRDSQLVKEEKSYLKKSPAQKSIDALNEIDRLAGDNEYLQKKGRELGLTEFKNYLKNNPGLSSSGKTTSESMKKLYVIKESNKSGKEIFEGQNYKLATIDRKLYNLVGDIDIDKPEEVMIYSSKTERPLHYAIIRNTNRTVNSKTKGSFLVLK